MIIMAIIAASGFIVLGFSFVGHKLQVQKERQAGEHKCATFQAAQAAGWPLAIFVLPEVFEPIGR
jgi:hypothetical protein